MNSPHELIAVTKREISARGAGIPLRAGISGTPFGDCLIADSPRGICCLSFIDAADEKSATAELREIWPLADVLWDPTHARALVNAVFKEERGMKVYVAGTDFQIRVWQALVRIPMGGTISYGELAATVGNPRASRATGSAVGANPVSFLIPCHRVIRANGETGHYHWGADRKRAILEWESNRITSG